MLSYSDFQGPPGIQANNFPNVFSYQTSATLSKSLLTSVVTDSEAIKACVEFANEHKCLVEPACGASLAVAYENREVSGKANSFVIIVCGGIGIDLSMIQEWESSLRAIKRSII